MAKVTMELIKELREITQVGMMDCKKALIESNGDIEKAIEIYVKKVLQLPQSEQIMTQTMDTLKLAFHLILKLASFLRSVVKQIFPQILQP